MPYVTCHRCRAATYAAPAAMAIECPACGGLIATGGVPAGPLVPRAASLRSAPPPVLAASLAERGDAAARPPYAAPANP